MRKDAKIDRLAGIPLFEGASRKQLDRIAQLCTEVRLGAGTVLCREGEAGSEFFVLESGTVRVSARGQQLAVLGPGSFFGELALLDAGPRTATVTAEEECTVLVLSRQEFAAVLEDEPQVAVRMLPAIGRRLRLQAQERSQAGAPPVV
ncbi:MAG TPA: cyclic nucleotide-binding domain-containing protein [Mycobacteriales bacterium]|nr:cyclic nucleotide-binding domain-containing protein [Mycobacteriales bacterium]